MNTQTGQIYESLEDAKKAFERGEPLMTISGRDVEKLKTIAPNERVAFAKKLARRKARKSKRKAERKRRGRR